MDSFEFNKVAGAVLAALLLIVAVGIISEGIFEHEEPEKKPYVVEGVTEEGAGATAQTQEEPFAVLLAQADVTAGQKKSGVCASCHTFEKGGADKQGPNLYGILGAARAHKAGFPYSDAIKSAGGSWTYDNLSAFLEKPAKAMPGTKMAFAGLSKAQDRANVIAYLRSNADSPLPLPEVPAAPAADAAAPAEAPATGAAATPAADKPADAKAAQAPAAQKPAAAAH